MIKTMKIVGIGGGSGAGKTSVCSILTRESPDFFEVMHLDDYQRQAGPDSPMVDTMLNWDHPDVVRWPDLQQDIETLRNGHDVEIIERIKWITPESGIHIQHQSRIIQPKPVVLVEGHLALHEAIHDTYDRTYFFDLNPETRIQRRRNARGGKDSLSGDDRYAEMVLKPMHELHVEPTRLHADLVINVGVMPVSEVASLILDDMQEHLR